MAFPETLHLFCRVVDNLGDIGVCWRLARQLAHEHDLAVTLWVDDLHALKKICAPADATLDLQRVSGVTIRRWPVHFGPVSPHETGDIVIEAFACDLPPAYIEAMAKREVAPVWINLEYLSAEAWVEGCHALASPHPKLPLVKHFFFPGFTKKTGGLILERDLLACRDLFQSDKAAQREFLITLGVQPIDNALLISLFCYPHAPIAQLFDALSVNSSRPVLCLVPQGVASEAITAFLQQPAEAGVSATREHLTVRVIPFVGQDAYDRLLWTCDLNFVRGEDSFVRAQWAARPFVWQIYPQQDGAHEVKLDAFLSHYLATIRSDVAASAGNFWHAWNGVQAGSSDMRSNWAHLADALPELAEIGPDWAKGLSANGDLAGSLVGFVRALR